MNTAQERTIGIVAGGGQFPLLFARAAKAQGYRVVAVAHRGETNAELADLADRCHWVRLGQLGRIIKCMRREGVRETVLLGTITKTNIFRDVRPDLKGLAMWKRIDAKQDDAILRAVAGAMEEEGIRVVASTGLLPELLFPRGLLTRTGPTAAQIEDINFGWRMAKEIGSLDIGQCVVVRDRVVLAVEAIEGTDAAIRRGGQLSSGRAVVVKIRKPCQDSRFDLPAVGLATIGTMAEVKGAVLAVEAGQALLFDAEATLRAADRQGIVVVGVEERPDGGLNF